MFDNAPERSPGSRPRSSEGRGVPEDERIALRCNRKELQLLDSFVAAGEFASRSELMREALRSFLRSRAMSTEPTPLSGRGIVEVPVRIRSEELETLRAYCALVGNGRPVPDLLAELVRRGELETKVVELVERARSSVRQGADTRARIGALEATGKDLERKGVVGR